MRQRHVLVLYLGVFLTMLLVNQVFTNETADIQDFDDLEEEPVEVIDVDPVEAKQRAEEERLKEEKLKQDQDSVSAEVIKKKYGVDMAGIFGSNMKFSKDAAEGLVSHASYQPSPSLKKKKDFKFYNNSYVYVTFRKPALEKETSNKLAVSLIKSTKLNIMSKFYNESAEHNNNTRYELLRKLKREIEKNETAKNPREEDAGNVPEPEMELEEQLKFAEEES
jgi:hypothetical protein